MTVSPVWELAHRVGSRVDSAAAPAATSAARFASPSWLADDAQVHRAIGAKRTHPPSGHFWARLAVLAQLGDAIASGRARDVDSLGRAQRLLGDLVSELPPAQPVLWDPRRPGPLWWVLGRRADPIADLSECAAALAVVLADPRPTCPYMLAVVLDELAITLWMCRNANSEGRASDTTAQPSRRAPTTPRRAPDATRVPRAAVPLPPRSKFVARRQGAIR